MAGYSRRLALGYVFFVRFHVLTSARVTVATWAVGGGHTRSGMSSQTMKRTLRSHPVPLTISARV